MGTGSRRIDEEIERICTRKKCGICVVPLASRDAAEKHYDGKIHGKKLERWKEKFEIEKEDSDDSDKERRDKKRREREKEKDEEREEKRLRREKEDQRHKEKDEEREKEKERRREEEKQKEAEREALRILEEDRKLAEEKKKAEDAAKRAAGIKTEADAISDIFMLAKKAREAIFLKKGEAELEREEKRKAEREAERESRERERRSRDRNSRDRDRYSRDKDRFSRDRDSRRSRDRDDRSSRHRDRASRDRDDRDRRGEKKESYREKYERELEEKMKELEKKKQEEEDAQIETWEERAKRKEREAKEEEKKKKEEERRRKKEEEGEVEEMEEGETWEERAMKKSKKRSDSVSSGEKRSGKKKKKHRSRSRSRKRSRSRSRNKNRSRSRSRDKKKKKEKKRDRSSSGSPERRRRRREREENNSRRSQEYEAEGGDEYTEGGGERADESEYSDLYAIPTEHSAPTRREMKDEEEKGEEHEEEEKGEDEREGGKRKEESQVPGVIDPRLLNSMDPETMRRVLMGKSRWEDELPEPKDPEKVETEPEPEDPNDMSIPIDPDRLLRRCFNPVTGIGYCQVCNKIFVSGKEANKHFMGQKHAAKVLIYQELILSEKAILAGTAPPAPPPHSEYYCELCESNCSSEKQMLQHLSGERHRMMVKGMEVMLAGDPKLDEDINPYNLPEVWLRERKHCNLCDIPIESIRIAKIHFNSKLHREAAGLNVLPANAEMVFISEGPHHCTICNFRTKTETELKTHNAGVRHLENFRTKLAVEAKGHNWNPHNPSPPLPPKYSVIAEALPQAWGGPGMMGPGMMGPGMMGPGMMGPGMMGPGMMGPGMMGPGMMGHGMMGPGMMGPGMMGPGMMGPGMMRPGMRPGMMGPGGMMPGPRGPMMGSGWGPGPHGMGGPGMGGPGMGMGGPGNELPPGEGPPGIGEASMGNGPPGPLGPNALMECQQNFSDQGKTADKIPDNVTFKEYYCTICKTQTENEADFEEHNNSEEHAINEANVEVFTCRLCKINLTSTYDYNMHLESPNHQRAIGLKQQRDHMRAMGQFVPDSDDEEGQEEQQFLPEPLSEDGVKGRFKTHPWHCGLCNSWFQSITILKFYHSVTEEHLALANSVERAGAVTCLICKVAGDNAADMMDKCATKQKMRIIGAHRQYSCEMCDVHLSEQEWLDNHNGGEKHRWTVDRVEKNLPVQFQPVDVQVIQKTGFNPFNGAPQFWQEFRCAVCKVGFTPIERYKKHIGSLFHVRRCAGEDVKWIDNGNN